MVFGDLLQNKTAVWSLLLISGYLKVMSVRMERNYRLCELSIPNKEVENYFMSVIDVWLAGARGFEWYRELMDDLAEGRAAALEKKLQALLREIVSCHDVANDKQESFYHGLMLGFVSGLKETHDVKSNRESGDGRYDVAIIPKDHTKLGIIMEFKAIKDDSKIVAEAEEALRQIGQTSYVAELEACGITRICQMGIAFSGKQVKLAVKQ